MKAPRSGASLGRAAPLAGRSDGDANGPWLLRHRVELPDPVTGYVERPPLEERCAPMERRLTVLHAPGGFGKTALLARCCRNLRRQGVAVAWLALDETDGSVALATYLAFAFEQAGLDTLDVRAGGTASGGAPASDPEADSRATYRINMLARVIEDHAVPCLLALDELERLDDPDSVALLNAFLRAAPRNLHLAMAFRSRPPGLDIAMFMLEGTGATVTTEELRFSTPDIARFFGTELSRRELAKVASSSSGWPIALRIYRSGRDAGSTLADVGNNGGMMAAWIESRLWRGLSEDDRDLVLDMALFDWIDATLIDEATGVRNSRRRIESMESLGGLLETRGDESTLHLHPLIRDYCANRRFREDPHRFRSIHAAIARTLAARGQVVEALRHAAEAGDTRLIANIAQEAGGIKIWFRRGFDALRTVDGWLTADIVATYPRLALVRCVMLAMAGDVAAADRLYHATVAARQGIGDRPQDAADRALQLDHLLVRGLLLVCGCGPVTRYESLVAVSQDLAREPDIDPMMRGMLRHGLCLTLNEMTDFERARDWGERARVDLGNHTLYLSPHIDYLAGMAAMAQGRVEDAEACYDRALKAGRTGHLGDAGTAIIGTVLIAELELERSAGAPRMRATPVSPRLLGECGAWLDIYAANTAVATELALHGGDGERALAVVDAALEFARRTGRSALTQLLSAMRISLLVAMERIDEAERAWRGADLPESASACLDLGMHRWREVEAFASARLQLLVARGEFEAGRELAAALRHLAEERCLVRTHMRSLALAMRLEQLAGAPDRATAHMAEYLRLYAEADFARPLGRERELALPLLSRIVDARHGSEIASTAAALRDTLASADQATDKRIDAHLTDTEFEVLRRLPRHSDKEIAKRLGLSYDAVRYRIRSVFGKLGARGRHDAVHRARSLGILSSEDAG